MRTPRLAIAFLLAALLAGAVPRAAAQDPPGEQGGQAQPAAPAPAPEAAAPAAPEDPVAALQKRRSEVSERLQALRERLAAGNDPATAVGLQAELELLLAIDRAYEQEIAALGRKADLSRQAEEAEHRLAAGPASALGSPPYALAVLDGLEDVRDAQARRTTALGEARDAAAAALEEARQAASEAEKARRLAREAAEGAEEPAESARLGAALRRARLESERAGARRDLLAVELENLDHELALQKDHQRLLDDTVEWVRERLSVDPDALSAPFQQLDALQADEQDRLERANRELAAAERRIGEVERRLDASPGDPVVQAEVDARRAQRVLAERRVAHATAQLARIDALRELWRQRVDVLSGGMQRSALEELEGKLEAKVADLERNRRLLEARRTDVQAELAQARQRQEASTQPDASRWLALQVGALQAQERLYSDALDGLADHRRLADRALQDVQERTARTTLTDRLAALGRGVARAWDVELLAVDDRPITVGKVVGAALLLALGFVVARLTSSALGRVVLRRMSVAAGATTAIQGLTFYALLLLFSLLALRTMNIPLTAFTVLGGALAIGVGFGSQNVVNNFISGLILMMERPIKVGDLIEVDSTNGYVEHIGPRSTRVRTFDNIHIIVPNSAFLEKNVINWTLADDDIRTHVDVGVVYGSPTREVARILNEILEEHPTVLEYPKHKIWFADFGDNALLFRAFFWIRSRNMGERLTIESEVRYAIDDRFREAGIVIAFPQRDVHLDSVRPIEVRVVEGEGRS